MEYLNAFLCGGILCAIGQILIDKTQLTPARILTGYVVAGVILSAGLRARPGQGREKGRGGTGLAGDSHRGAYRHGGWYFRRCGIWRVDGNAVQTQRKALTA